MHASRLVSLVTVTVALRAVAAAQAPADIFPALAREPEWRLTDPAYLYLAFSYKGVRGDSLTWLHPVRNRSNWCEEAIAPNQKELPRAFAYHLSRETPQGYEVAFQPIDPTEPSMERPFPRKIVTVIFPKSERKRFQLTQKLSVVGFYGSPHPPWGLP
jgi:hypothetical protein